METFWDVFWSTFEAVGLEVHDLTDAGSDVVVGNILTDPLEDLVRSLERNPLNIDGLPACAGPHCTSLFDDPANWS